MPCSRKVFRRPTRLAGGDTGTGAADSDPAVQGFAIAAPTVALVGKGVVFDTGGLDIKPRSSMRNMKKDMGGAAVALGLARTLLALGVDLNLLVVIGAVENAVSAGSFRPGDVLQTRKGLTVEVGTRTRKGRLVLADCLTYAGEQDPDLILDFATLTGSARVALGPDLPPVMARDNGLSTAMAQAGHEAGDPLWPMPLYLPYAQHLRSAIADLCNITEGFGFAGSITAGLFLEKFVPKGTAWAHFDLFCWNPSSRPGRPAGERRTRCGRWLVFSGRGSPTGGRRAFQLIARRLAPPREARSGTSRRNFLPLTHNTLKGAAVLSAKVKLRARFDAASRLTNLPRAVKQTGRTSPGLTSFRIFSENVRGRAEGREAAKARARHLSIHTQDAEFILSLQKDFKYCWREEHQRAQSRRRVERKAKNCAALDPAARSAVGGKSAQPVQYP